VTHIYWGSRTFDGVESAGAWKSFGYDIDHQTTTTSFGNHCKPRSGAAAASVFPDGDFGIDNAFGKLLVPVLKTALSSRGDLEEASNETISAGQRTLLFDLPTLGTGSNYDPVAGAYFGGRNQTGEDWQKAPSSFNGDTPKLQFPAAYVREDTWVSGIAEGDLDISFGGAFVIHLHHVVVTGPLDGAREQIVHGMISGVLDTEEFASTIGEYLGAIDVSFCGVAGSGVMNQMRQASDIMNDGTQSQSTCNGISIGLGFDAVAVTAVGLAPPDPTPVDPCP